MARGTNPKTKVYRKRMSRLKGRLSFAVRYGAGRDLFEAVDRADPDISPEMLMTAIDEVMLQAESDLEDLRAGIAKLEEFRTVIRRAALQVVA